MPDDENGKLHRNLNNYLKPKGVYELLEKLNVPETTPWKGNLKFPLTNKMLRDTMDKLG